MSRRSKLKSRTWTTDARWIAPVAVLVAAAIAWAGFHYGYVRWIYRDGNTIWDSRDRLNIRSVLWSPPRELPDSPAGDDKDGTDRTDGDEGAPASRGHSISAASLLLAARTPRGDYDIYVRDLTPSGWSDPVPLGGPDAPIHSPHNEITPKLGPRGDVLYFASDRPRGLGGFDLYASRLGPDGPGEPVHLGSRINSPFDELGPAPHPSGRLLAFATNRPRSFLFSPPAEWEDVPLDSWKPGDEELAYSFGPLDDRLRGGWSDPQPLLELTSEGRDTTPVFSPGGTFIYFASDRSGGAGGLDLYRARCRLTGLDPDEITVLDVRAPENVGPPVNTRLDDSHPSLFLEGFALAYRVEDTDRGVEGFFESRSREVAPELSFAAIPMEVVTAYVVRVGGMLLLGAVLVLATVLLMRYRRFLSLSLSLRCAAVAILIHVAMFYGFYLWKVGSDFSRLSTKTALAEVSIERTLEAKLTLETQRMNIELPEQEPAPVVTAEPRASAFKLVSETAPTVAAREFSVESIEALPPASAPALAAAPPVQPPDPSRLEVVNVATVTVRPEPEDLRTLPQVEPSPPTPEPEMTPGGAPSSMKVEAATPKEGPVAPLVEVVDSAAAPPMEVAVAEARTPVQAPVPDPALLPPVAEPDPDPPEIVHELPLPAQSSESEAAVTAAPAPAAGEPSAHFSPAVARVAPTTTLAVDVARVTRPAEARWSASPAGLARVRDDIAEATEFEEAPLQPLRAAAPIPSASAKLPEVAAVGETTAARESASSHLAPRAGEKRLTSMPARSARITAPLVSSTTLPEMGPRTAPSDATAVVSAASPAPLRSLPTPGSAAPAAPASRARPLSSVQVRLPEGEGGVEPAAGAERVADVLDPATPRPRARKMSFDRLQATRAAPPRRETRASDLAAATRATPPAGRPVARPALAGTAAPPALTAPEPRPLSDAPETALSAVASRFPEQDPKKIEHDLREVRSEPSRKLLVRTMGGSAESEDAVRLGLEWLARNQASDGRWDVDGFRTGCSDCGTPGFQTRCDVAVTGLAILCFLGQNHTPNQPKSPYRRHVANAIRWLVRVQRRDGVIAGEDSRHIMYNHGIATLALSEAYILTGDGSLRGALEKARDVIVGSQNPRTGGWRYQPTPPIRGDTSISGWQIMALTSLRNGSIYVPNDVFDLARHWLDEEVSSGRHKGIYGYTRPEEARVAMVAEGMFVRQLLGSRRTDANVEESARYVHTQTTRENQLDNLYLIYYGTMGLYQYQGWIWERWNTRVRDFLVRTQHRRGRRAGSWDPAGPWSEAGGSILSTCFSILTLQVYYRYLPLFWQAGEAPSER